MTYESNYLAHHGVKGQKWGVRKQYESVGKSIQSLGGTLERERNNRLETRALQKAPYRSSDLDDREIDALIARMKRENELSRLISQRENAGKLTLDKILKNAGTVLAIAGSAAGLAAAIYKVRESKLNFAREQQKAAKAVDSTKDLAKGVVDEIKKSYYLPPLKK